MSKVLQAQVTDANPIVEIRAKYPMLRIQWVIGIRCNFACSYCPDVWHDKTSPHKTLDELKGAWRKFVQQAQLNSKRLGVSIIGGEPTMNPNLLPFLQWVSVYYRQLNSDINLYSNGTDTLDNYKKLSKYCNFYFSTHSEFMNEHKFFSMVKGLSQHVKENNINSNITVLVMDESWNKDRTPQYIDFLKENNINCILSPVEPAWQPGSNWPAQEIRPSSGLKKASKVNFYERVVNRIA